MRKTKIVTVPMEGRDYGKRFLLTEMSAGAAERWAMRAFLALARSGIDIPGSTVELGFMGMAAMGIRALMTGGIIFEEVEPLLDQMMECVRIMPDPHRPEVIRPITQEDDIEEVGTFLWLRKEVFDLHANFSSSGDQSKSTSPSPQEPTTSQASSTTPPPASPTSSGLSSHRAKRRGTR